MRAFLLRRLRKNQKIPINRVWTHLSLFVLEICFTLATRKNISNSPGILKEGEVLIGPVLKFAKQLMETGEGKKGEGGGGGVLLEERDYSLDRT